MTILAIVLGVVGGLTFVMLIATVQLAKLTGAIERLHHPEPDFTCCDCGSHDWETLSGVGHCLLCGMTWVRNPTIDQRRGVDAGARRSPELAPRAPISSPRVKEKSS